MSKTTRIVLASLVTLAVIIGIYTSVEGASLSARQDKAGSHTVSGALVNLDHFRSAQPELQQYQAEDQKSGYNCESEMKTSPDD